MEAAQRFGSSVYIVGMTVGKMGTALLSHKVGRSNRYVVVDYRFTRVGVRFANVRSGFASFGAGRIAYRERVEG
jgi:hypothetical protein